jgi:hypothetical protein
MIWLRTSSPVSQPGGCAFSSRLVRVKYVVKVALGQVFSLQVLRFSPVTIIPLLRHTRSVTCHWYRVTLKIDSIVK